MDFLFQARQDTVPTSQYVRVKALKENVALVNFLQANGVSSMNSGYYELRGKIVKAERRISFLTERLEMWAQYQKYKPIRQKLGKVCLCQAGAIRAAAQCRPRSVRCRRPLPGYAENLRRGHHPQDMEGGGPKRP